MNPEWTWKQECFLEPEFHSRLRVSISFQTRLILAQLDHHKRHSGHFSDTRSGKVTPIGPLASLLSANKQV